MIVNALKIVTGNGGRDDATGVSEEDKIILKLVIELFRFTDCNFFGTGCSLMGGHLWIR